MLVYKCSLPAITFYRVSETDNLWGICVLIPTQHPPAMAADDFFLGVRFQIRLIVSVSGLGSTRELQRERA